MISDLSFVIVVFNQLDQTKRCIESIRENIRVPFELILVDNGSTDDTEKYFRAYSEEIVYVRNRTNPGLAIALNQGIRRSKSDYICAVHNDVIICDRTWLQKVSNLFETETSAGLIGFYGAKRLRKSLSWMGRTIVGGERGRNNMKHEYERVAIVDGLCLLFKKSFVQAVGGFDEQFFMHGYDLDLSLKAIRGGYKNFVVKVSYLHQSGKGRSSEQYRRIVPDDLRLRQDVNAKIREKWSSLLPVDVRAISERFSDWILKKWMRKETGLITLKRDGIKLNVKNDYKDDLLRLGITDISGLAKRYKLQVVDDVHDPAIVSTTLTHNNFRETIIIKQWERQGQLRILKDIFRPCKAVKEWKISNELLRRGIQSPVPLAVGERRKFRLLSDSFLINRKIPNAVNISHYISSLTPPLSEMKRREKWKFIRSLAGTIKDVHNKGLFHGDLNTSNIMVQMREGKEPVFYFVDFGGSGLRKRLYLNQRIKDLARLNESMPSFISRTDKVRFFLVYSEKLRLSRKERKKIIVRIEARTRAKSLGKRTKKVKE